MKINDKQRFIMRLAGMFLFAVALILTLDLVFNGSKVKIDDDFVGTWKIGYKFFKGETNQLLYSFEQELFITKDGKFYTNEKYIPGEVTNSVVSGTVKVEDNKITMTYTQNNENKTNTLFLKDNKLCTSALCKTYYTLDKIDKYFPIYNAEDSED